MKHLLIAVGLATLVYGCAVFPSPYITECEQPACELQAAERPFEAVHNDGVSVVINSDFSLIVDKPIQDLIHQKDILIISFSNETKVAAATQSLDDYGLETTELSASAIMDLAFMEKFGALPNRLSPEEKHIIRAIKLDAMNGDKVVKYYNDKLNLYFYSESDTRHKVYVVVGQSPQSWVMLDFYNIMIDRAKELLFTIEVL